MLWYRDFSTFGEIVLSFRLKRAKFLKLPEYRPANWTSHMMAPAPLPLLDSNFVDVFVGGWDLKGISLIYSVQVNLNLLELVPKTAALRLDKGAPGNFDENGVFPGSIILSGEEWFLSYTGFQLGHKIPHYNFAGLAVPGLTALPLSRLSDAPILDRADEGLTVRAGLSAIKISRESGRHWLSAYAAGSTFEMINGKLRPNYCVFTQFNSPFELEKFGQLKVSYKSDEHGIGRPYLIQYGQSILLFYTRRCRNFKYLPGVAISEDGGKNFIRRDELLENVTKRIIGIDDEMQYFPAPYIMNNLLYVFYNGNNFGQFGMGVWEFQLG